MLNLICDITIEQKPTKDYPSRSKKVSFNFVHEIEIESSWANLTDTARLTFPKKLTFTNPDNGEKINWDGKNIIANYGNMVPLILRGDQIFIKLGYTYKNEENDLTTELNTEFEGYITKVHNQFPVTLDCEDNMFKLKQLQAPNKTWENTKYDVESMIKEMLNGTDFTLETGAKLRNSVQTNIGDFVTHNETVAQVLARLRKDYRIESYFRGKELRCSGLAYYPEDRREYVFAFQQNIISDNLDYQRTDDINIGVMAYSINKVELSTMTKAGKRKTKQTRLQVFVSYENGKLVVKDSKPSGYDGEVRTLYFWNVTSKEKLAKHAENAINKIQFTGYRGDFTTFGLPSVRHGDGAIIRDKLIPEREGTYLVKAVKKVFGMGGFRQSLQLDFKISGTTLDIEGGL